MILKEVVIEELNKVDKSKWAIIWNYFNILSFPKYLEKIKPNFWVETTKEMEASEYLEIAHLKTMFAGAIMKYIEEEIGYKACAREFFLRKGVISALDFEQHWDDSNGIMRK
jgi:hypothetical protein